MVFWGPFPKTQNLSQIVKTGNNNSQPVKNIHHMIDVKLSKDSMEKIYRKGSKRSVGHLINTKMYMRWKKKILKSLTYDRKENHQWYLQNCINKCRYSFQLVIAIGGGLVM